MDLKLGFLAYFWLKLQAEATRNIEIMLSKQAIIINQQK